MINNNSDAMEVVEALLALCLIPDGEWDDNCDGEFLACHEWYNHQRELEADNSPVTGTFTDSESLIKHLNDIKDKGDGGINE